VIHQASSGRSYDPLVEMQTIFRVMKAAHGEDINPDYKARRDRLMRLEQTLLAFTDRLMAAMMKDFGHRSPAESGNFDITLLLGDIRMNRDKMKEWMRPRSYAIPKHLLPARGRVIPQPKGVVGVIAPWNFPVYMAISPVAAALAAGNRVMVKPSELTPHTSDVIKAMIEAVFDPREVAVSIGGVDVAQAFSSLAFDHILFTGSTQVGRQVAVAAAKNLTPVTLELGGKSPAIVGKKADLAYAAKRIAYGKTANGGQICVAPDYALVPRGQMERFVREVEKAMHKFFPDFTQSQDYTAIISDRHRARLQSMVEEAEGRGAKVKRLADCSQAACRIEAPTLLIDPPLDIKAMEEEIFGPILPIIPYDTIDEAMAFVSERPAPLSLYIFTDNDKERDIWLGGSLSGGVCVNEVCFHVAADTLPFGGVGESGMGAYHGQAGFETFSHMKSVLYQPKLNGTFLFNPPISGFQRYAAKILRKII